jgi:hypothetical protein
LICPGTSGTNEAARALAYIIAGHELHHRRIQVALTGRRLAAKHSLAGLVADPVVTVVISHLGKVKAILDAAGKLGLTGGGIGMGIKEARDLYKEFSK